jgi:predicted TIM-barrel fold metal-dependent hydrolase
LPVIDSDAHVEESDATWSYLDPAFYPWRPLAVVFPEDTCFGDRNAGWIIDYKLRRFAATPTLMKQASEKGVPISIQEMKDVAGRLECMDELGIDRQVVFPSAWLGTLAENVELEAALANSYNQFMAAQCAQSGDRLWYVAVVAWRRPDLAVKEIQRVKEQGGAAGIFARGIEWDMPLSHPSFRPIFQEAEQQDLPIAVHVGNGSSPMISRMFEGIPRPAGGPFPHPAGSGIVSGPYVLYAFQQILSCGLLNDFPRLRVGFLEAGADWTVQLVKGLRRSKNAKVDSWLGEQVFVSCRIDDDLPYLINKLGEDFLITATDFPHGDANRQDRLAEGLLREGHVPEATVQRILSDNPRRLWHGLA